EFAPAIDFLAAILPGVSSPPIPRTSFAMLALVHVILAADAGDSASAANAVASNKVFIKFPPPENEASVMPANAAAIFPGSRFAEKRRSVAPACGFSALLRRATAPAKPGAGTTAEAECDEDHIYPFEPSLGSPHQIAIRLLPARIRR